MPLDQTNVTGTCYDVNGEPVAGVKVFVNKVIKNGTVIQYRSRQVATSDEDGAIAFDVPRDSQAWIEGSFFSGSTNFGVRGGVQKTIPDLASTTLETLGDALPLDPSPFSVLNAAINVVSNALSNEMSVRSAADAALSVRIDNVSVPGGSGSVTSQEFSVGVVALSLRIDAASQAASVADNHANAVSAAVVLASAAISVEAADRASADGVLSTRIDTASNAASVADVHANTISAAVVLASAAISAEVLDRVSADNVLSGRINTVSNAVSVLSSQVSNQGSAIVANSAQMTSADNALLAAINVVSTALSNELSVRAAADDALSVRIDTVSNAHSSFRAGFAGGSVNKVLKKNSNTDFDYSWQNDETGGGGASVTSANLALETSNRISSDNVLSTRIDTVSQTHSADSLSVNNRISGVSANVTSVAGRLDGVSANVTSIAGRVDTNSAQMVSADNAISAAQAATSAAAAAISTNVTSVAGRLDTVSGNQTSIAGRLDTVSANQTSISGRLDGVSANVTSVGGRLDTLSAYVNKGIGSEFDGGLASTASVTIDWANGSRQKFDLSGVPSFANPSNLSAGKVYILRLSNGTSAAHSANWASAFVFPNSNTPPTLGGSSAIDLITFYCDGTNLLGSYGGTTGGSGSVTSNELSTAIATEVANRTSAIGVLSNTVSALSATLSTAISAISQSHSALSAYTNKAIGSEYDGGLASTASVVIDFANGRRQKFDLSGVPSFATPTNLSAGASYVLRFSLGTSAAHSANWASAFVWDGGTPPSLGGSSATDIIAFYTDGTFLYGASDAVGGSGSVTSANFISARDALSNAISVLSATLSTTASALSVRVDTQSAALVSVNNRISGVSGNVTSISGRLDTVSANETSISGRLDTVSAYVNKGIGAEFDGGVASTASVVIDWANGARQKYDLSGVPSFAAPTNMSAGKTYILRLSNGTSAAHSANWASAFVWPNSNTPPTLGGSSAVDILAFYCDGSNLYGSYGGTTGGSGSVTSNELSVAAAGLSTRIDTASNAASVADAHANTVSVAAAAISANLTSVSGRLDGVSANQTSISGRLDTVSAYVNKAVGMEFDGGLASTASVTIDWANGGAQKFDVSGVPSFANPTGMSAGRRYIIRLSNGTSAAHSANWASAFVWPGGTPPTLGGSSAVDLLAFYCDGTNLLGSYGGTGAAGSVTSAELSAVSAAAASAAASLSDRISALSAAYSTQVSTLSDLIIDLSLRVNSVADQVSVLSARVDVNSAAINTISAGLGAVQLKVIATDQSVSAVGLTKISGLSISAAAEGIYQLDGYLMHTGSALSVFGFGLSVQTGTLKKATGSWRGNLSVVAAVSVQVSVTMMQRGFFNEASFGSVSYSALCSVNGTLGTKLDGVVAMSTTGGTIQLKAKSGGTGVITLAAGSYVRAFKLA